MGLPQSRSGQAAAAAAASLKTICLKELYNGAPVIGIGCSSCCRIGSLGLSVSNFSNLEILHHVKTVAERCKLLRKLHIDGCKANGIGDEGLSAVAKYCPNLQVLVLIGLNPTKLSLHFLSSNCLNLERLALCESDTVGDAEISCIVGKCIALKKLCIKRCPVAHKGMEVLASGCPNLVKVKVKKCGKVTCAIADWLKASRGSLLVNLDSGEQEPAEASMSDGGLPDNGVEFPPMFVETVAASTSSIASSRN